MNRVAIYCRIDGPVNEHSQALIDSQKNKLTNYAHSHYLNIRGYYEDIGYSGHMLDRPGLQQLIKDIKADKIDVILVTNQDRLYRGTATIPKSLKSLLEKDQSIEPPTEL